MGKLKKVVKRLIKKSARPIRTKVQGKTDGGATGATAQGARRRYADLTGRGAKQTDNLLNL